MTSETLMNRYFTLPLFWAFLLFSPLVVALDMEFGEVAPGVYAYIGETGMRTYDNEGMNANSGFIVTETGVVVVDRLLGVLPFSTPRTGWPPSKTWNVCNRVSSPPATAPCAICPRHGAKPVTTSHYWCNRCGRR